MSKVQYSPLPGYVVVAPFERETESKTGFVLEAEAKANHNTEGVVRVVNEEDASFNPELYSQVGDVVAFVTGASVYEKQVNHDGEQCYILPIGNIIATVS